MPWYSFYFVLAISLMRNDVNTGCLCTYVANHNMSSDGVEQGLRIAVITSENLTEIQTATKEAMRDVEENVNRSTQFIAKVFHIENHNASLQSSLVKFCDEVIGENVTAVIMTDVLKQGQFNFVPWISSLGIPVTFLRNTPGFSTKQVEEYRTVFSMKPAPEQQASAISDIISLYQWTRIAVISTQPSRFHFSELIQQPNELLQINITETTNYEELSLLLSDVKKSHSSVVVLDCPDKLVKHVIHSAQDMGLFNGDPAWVVTESVTEGSSGISRLPVGLIGLRLRGSCESQVSASLHDVLYDSLMVYAHARKSLIDKGRKPQSSYPSCYSDITNTSTTENTGLLRQILGTIITGKTGPIQFDRFGNRVNSEYDIMNLQTKSNGQKEWIKIGQWGKNGLVCNKKSIQWLGSRVDPPRNIRHTRILRVATAITEPFAFFSGALKGPYFKGDKLFCAVGFPCKVYQSSNGSNTTERKCCQGFVIDLLGMLENDLGFKADLHLVKDGKYGALVQGQWNGLIGELVRGEVDLAIADLTITDKRSRAVDFTQPFLHSGMNILVAVRIIKRTGWLLRFLEPFTTELWVLSIITINIIVILLWLIDRTSPCGHYRKGKDYKERKKFHLIASLWFSWGTVFHIDECEARPRSYSSRLITVVFAFAMLVLTNTYTANLAAVLVSEREMLPMSGIHDPKLLNSPKGFTVGTVADTSLEKLFKGSQDAMYSQIWRNMKANSVRTFAEGVRKVIDGELTGFIGDEPTLSYHISKQTSCNLKLAGKSFFQSGFGLALPKNSSLTKRLSAILIQYEQLDVSRKLAERWLRGSCIKKGPSFTRMKGEDIGGAFGIVFVGVFVSFLFLAFEIYVDRFGFPLSHIWTNKPHRFWPSTRELYWKGLLGKKSAEPFSLAPLELSLGERRVTPSFRDPWNSLVIYSPQSITNRRHMVQDFDNDSLRSLNISHTPKNTCFDEGCEDKTEEQDSGRAFFIEERETCFDNVQSNMNKIFT